MIFKLAGYRQSKNLNTDLKKSFFLAFKRWVEDQISWLLKDALKSDFLAFKRWVEIKLGILLSWIRIRVRIRSMRIHITATWAILQLHQKYVLLMCDY